MKLKKFLLALFGAAMLPFTSCGDNNKNTTMETNDNKAVVCYFSATGTTEAAAKRIAKIAGADVHEIAPAVKYTSADLDWTDSVSPSYVEMHNRTFRPVLKDSVTDLSEYSVVYIGYPNWWNTHPTIINTFIENNNLQGKTIVPFMTSGGSNIINSEKKPLTDNDTVFLYETADLMVQYPTIPCNDCKYCMPCPYGLDIPAILLHYNKCVN